jgi:hypothetical protein
MEPLLLSDACRPLQGPAWRRRRLCLLKDCDQWYRPVHPWCRYCSEKCRREAERWRRWRARQKYRASSNGRKQRQQQARRYRERCRARPPACPAPVVAAPSPADSSVATREGKRSVEKIPEGPGCPCARPGCYVLFPAGSEHNRRRFCCALCCKALRCVLDREARWRRRHRRGLKQPGRRPRPRIRSP